MKRTETTVSTRRPLGRGLGRTFALAPEDAPFVTTVAEVIAARLAGIGVTATLIAPETAIGLRPKDLDRVETALLAARTS